MIGVASRAVPGPGMSGPVSASHATSSFPTFCGVRSASGLKRVPPWSLPKLGQSSPVIRANGCGRGPGARSATPLRRIGSEGASGCRTLPAVTARITAAAKADHPRTPVNLRSADFLTGGSRSARPSTKGANRRGRSCHGSKPTSQTAQAVVQTSIAAKTGMLRASRRQTMTPLARTAMPVSR